MHAPSAAIRVFAVRALTMHAALMVALEDVTTLPSFVAFSVQTVFR